MGMLLSFCEWELGKTFIISFLKTPVEKVEEFTRNSKKLFGKKFENITQVRTLENLRDTLLPKLMSGEVRVAS
jgi:type I restriction enzyme S subunit